MFRTEVPEVSSRVHSFLVLEYLDQFKYPCLMSLYSVILLRKILQCYAVSIFFPPPLLSGAVLSVRWQWLSTHSSAARSLCLTATSCKHNQLSLSVLHTSLHVGTRCLWMWLRNGVTLTNEDNKGVIKKLILWQQNVNLSKNSAYSLFWL